MDNDAIRTFVNPNLIVTGLEAADKSEAVRHLAALLKANGYVKDSYADAVLEREKSFPTGLPTEEIQVALPHTDVVHCLKPGMAIGLLKKPVEFFEMATLDRTVNAEIIFLLSITVPSDQVVWLSRLVTLFQRPGFLREFKSIPDPQACYELLCEELGKEEE
jgi:PTS system galactitol-specific IIA component